jgi:hypothetical protein
LNIEYWGRATTLEKIISLLMAHNENIRNLQAIRQILARDYHLRLKIHEINDALQRLTDLRLILRQIGKDYEFAVAAFPHVVAKTLTFDDIIEEFIETYKEQNA